MLDHIGPRTQFSDGLHATKYRGQGEDYREAVNRLCFALKDDDDHYKALRQIILPMRFLFGGRIQASMGNIGRRTTAYNCFVSGPIRDTYVEAGGIMDRAKEAAATMRAGGGIGYDFSTLRPRGFRVAGIESNASGPVSFMPIYDAVCLATSSYGHRRGAQMAVLRCDHPDIEEFISAKQNNHALRGFNISVGVTDEFMEAVYGGKTFMLRFGSDYKREVDAAMLWEKIMRSTWDWAEPGVIFLDTIKRMNNLHYCEEITTTNPCGEQPLPPFGACLLGSFNLTAYLTFQNSNNPDRWLWSFDFDQLKADIPVIVRAMDNVIDRTVYPLAEQRAEAIAKRRMGIGVAGLANAVEACGHDYGSLGALLMQNNILEMIRNETYLASVELARQKGDFPLFDGNRFLQGGFAKTLPTEIRDLIARFGLRNSHLTSIAPTGTISMTADNISSGIEPVIYHELERPINTPEGQAIQVLKDFGSSFLHVKGKTSAEVTSMEHVNVLLHAQGLVDSAVSKTCNVDGKMPWEDFKDIYKRAHEGGAKGCTTFNADGERGALLKPKARPEDDERPDVPVLVEPTLIGHNSLVGAELAVGGTCEIDTETGRRSCD